MRFHKLRIATSVVCGITCMLLIALWMRSYRVNEVIVFPAGGTKLHAQSLCGRIILGRAANGVSFRQEVTGPLRQKQHKHENMFGFGYYRARFGDLFSVCIPNWFLVASFGTSAALPWMRYRFSLRTLLVGMTLVAAMLGLIVASI